MLPSSLATLPRRLSTLLAFGFLATAQLASADIIPADRRTVWNPGVPGGVPTRTTICANISAATYGNGSSDATSGIQSAINACPVNQVVLLGVGTFRIATGPIRINKGIVLRGAGPTQTILNAPDGTNQAVVVLGYQWDSTGGSTNLTADAVKGTSSVTVASTAGFVVGNLVYVDKLTDTALTWWSATSPLGDASRAWFSRANRPLAQVMEISSIVGNTITFTTPFHITFDTAHTAQLNYFAHTTVKYAGLEDVKVHGGEGGDGGGNVRFDHAAYSWARNIESEFSKGASIRLIASFRCTIRDSYAHTSKNPNPGGDGYGLEASIGSADNLIENNISIDFNKVILMRASGGGNVVGYNYFEDGYGQGYKTIVETGLNASHMTTPHYELFEGNEAFNFGGDARWGNSIYITFFRNHSTTLRRSLWGQGLSDQIGRVAIQIGARHYWYNFIGNVLGYSGMNPSPGGTSFTYEYPGPSGSVPMWKMGIGDSVGTPEFSSSRDLQVAATALRDGNFDYATNVVHWDNPAQTIPDSLYLTSKPAFFAANQWPWVDPLGATKLYTLPARARFDAGNPNPVTYPLTVQKAGTGTGTATSAPTGVSCGADCSESYNSGTAVTLTAAAATGSTFSGWSGACSGTGSCPVMMDAAKAATATFTANPPVTFTLTVTKAGTGSGTATSAPAGVSCGADCSEAYNSGTAVTLTAAAATGSTFTGWSGACSGTGTCQVTMDAARAVTSTFTLNPPVTFTLTVTKAGTGSGTATSAPAGVSCGADCSESYNTGTAVTLTAAATTGSTFTGWSGACSGTGTCQVTMDAAKAATATFAVNTFALTVTTAGTGTGTATSSPAGVSCGADCSEAYNSGTVVTLTAAAATGSTFSGWSGACSGTGTCQVTMDAAKAATATFTINPPVTFTLTVTKAGTGSGTATSAPAGVSCGSDCSELYNSGTAVTLTAAAATGSSFTGWSGACSGTGTCQVTMDSAKAATATFTINTFTLSVTKAGTGSGTATSSPAGVSCGSDCSELYNSGTAVTLTAAATTGSTFTGWSGACSGTGTCQVTMDVARAVTSTFTINPPVTFALTVTTAGTGTGVASSSPAGVSCGSDCSELYNSGTAVTLTAAAATGSSFTGWSGACSGTGTCQVTMDAAKAATATFAINTYTLTVTTAGTGTGTATSSPAGVSCGSDCSELYNSGTAVTLTAAAATGSTFTGWSGACSGTGTCQVTMDAAKAATATFAINTYTLTVTTAGTGSGTATSSPAGVSCGSDCSELYNSGTAVTLTAAAATGSTFTGWSGACTGTGTCQVTMDAPRAVTSTFTVNPPVTFTLTVTKAGTGSGTATSAPAGVSCGSDCSELYNSGTAVTLTAAAATGSTFTGWSGACSGTGTCQVTMDAAKAATATFTINTFTLSVTKAGTGSGTATSSPAGVSCGSDCSELYNSGTAVTLTAAAATGSSFTGWSGACSGTGTCQVTMDAAKAATATFTINTFTLSVTKAGTGSGTATSSPAGVSCGSDCSELYNSGTAVTLTAAAATGSSFTGWSGACSGTGTCQVTMDAAKSVAATFTINTFTLSVTKAGTGSGTATSSPAGVSCGSDCSELYNSGTAITLTAAADQGSSFAGWSGACSGTGTCQVTMDAAKSVAATFTINTYTLTVTTAGTGTGTATSSPAGVSCGADCSEAYNWNTAVTLTAAAATGSTFTGWSGACSGTGTCQVTMDAAKAATATFTTDAPTTFTLTVTMAGTGIGTVTSSPAGVSCGVDCSEAYNQGATVTLTAAIVTKGSSFAGWGGACSGTGTCQVTMDAAQAVTATFTARPVVTYILTVTTAGTGTGTVTSSPAGVSCGSDCSEPYNSGTVVVLTATADQGSSFLGWTGACSGAGGSCKVGMKTARETTATFSVESSTAQAVWQPSFAANPLETPYVGDFNGDGKTDIVTFTRQNPKAVGQAYVSLSDGSQFGDSTMWNDWVAINADEQVVIGDYDGDGMDDVATWLGTTTGQVYVARSLGKGFGTAEVWLDGIGFDPSDVLLSGDVNGDGTKDLVLFARAKGQVYVALSLVKGFAEPVLWHSFFAASPQERPAVADLDGDGKADIVAFATGSSTVKDGVYVALSNGTNFGNGDSSTRWRDWSAVKQTETVRIGDLDGDRMDDFFTFLSAPSAQCYTVRSMGKGMDVNVLWPESVASEPGDQPFVGDANGDGKADVITFARGQGKVYVSLGQ